MPSATLSGGEIVVVDPEDAHLLTKHRWRAACRYEHGRKVGVNAVAAGSASMGRLVLLHRLIMAAGPDEIVDHIDGNPLNNSRANLRFCTHAENMANRAMHKNNASGFKGVYCEVREGRRPRWRACISKGCKKIHLGSFKTPQEAAEAYNKAAKLYHGEFARAA